MNGNDQKILSLISDRLKEMTESLREMNAGLQAVRRDIAEATAGRKLPVERINDKLEKLIIGMSNLDLTVKGFTAPGVLAGYKVRHPEQIDTEPIDIYDEVSIDALDIQRDVDARCEAFRDKMFALTADRDSTQYLADCVKLLSRIRDEIVSRRDRVEALRQRRRNADKGSNEQKNASVIMMKIKGMIEPLEMFAAFVLNSYFARRKRMIAEIWRTTVAIERMFDDASEEFQMSIPKASNEYRIESALRELTEITKRHTETHRANCLVKSGDMTVLERRKILAGLKP